MDVGKNITKYIGITSNVIFDRVGFKGYEWIANAGFDSVDFNMQRGFYDALKCSYPENFLESVQEHKRIISQIGLRVSQTHGPYYFSDEQLKDWNDLEKYFQAVDLALQATMFLECNRFVIHPLYCMPWMKRNADIDNLRLTKMLVERLLKSVCNNPIYICIENLPYDFCNSLESHKKYLELGHSENVKGCFDLGHALVREADPIQHLNTLKDEIYAVHLHDNDRRLDLHDRIDVNNPLWRSMMNELRHNQNIDTISLETSGIYKYCLENDIRTELRKDFETVQVLIRQ